jgi:RimJ/RimL family protein N-acetyltransferase
MPRIEVNEHCYLSDLQTDDQPAIVEHLQDKHISDCTLRIPHPYTPADAAKWLGIVAENTRQHGEPTQFAVRDRDGRCIGAIGFDDLITGHRAEIGYWLAKPWRGRGLMTEIIAAACGYAIGRWKLVRIYAHVFDFNAASARVLLKNGFEHEGRLRRHVCKHGEYLDADVFALVTDVSYDGLPRPFAPNVE